MNSLGTMVKRIIPLADTKDVTPFENDFIRNLIARTRQGRDTTMLSEKQIGVIESIHKKHFGDAQ